MIDMPPTSPPAQEQLIEQKMIQCGLKAGAFTVKYEDYLQSIEVVIEKTAGASEKNIDCIKDAAGVEIVTFRDAELQKVYNDRVYEAMRPKMLADAEADLEKRGRLNGLPERASFGSDKLFGEALERHCGLRPGSFFTQAQEGLVGRPREGRWREADMDKMACLMSAIIYVTAKGEGVKFGFIGNATVVPDK